MDLALTDEQRAWQLKARKFAAEKIAPISLKCDQVADPSGTFDWEIIKAGSRLGFRTAVVPPQYGGHCSSCRTDLAAPIDGFPSRSVGSNISALEDAEDYKAFEAAEKRPKSVVVLQRSALALAKIAQATGRSSR